VIINIDLTGDSAVELVEPEDFKRFQVTVRGGDTAALEEVLATKGIGRLLPSGDAMIDTSAVARMAGGRVSEDWEAKFDAMLMYAASKGWMDGPGGSIQAHVERVD
jgi:hypothetical protein